MSNFRLNGRYLFLTYPQCSIGTDDAERIVREKLGFYEWSLWGRELHADGNPHLHAFVYLSQRCNLHTSACLDLVLPDGRRSHGNYRVAHKPKDVLDYVSKGGDFQFFGTTMERAYACFATAGTKRSKMYELMDALKQGKTLSEATEENPDLLGTAVLHGSKLLAFHAQSLLEKMKPPKKMLDCAAPFGESSTQDLKIATWLKKNLMNPRLFGQKQLWICGPTMHGKTSLLMELSECFRIYWVPPDEDYYCTYNDNSHDLIVLDEYKHQKTIQFLNRFVDGSPCPLKRKGVSSGLVKVKNLPVIVCSNLRMRECYNLVDMAIFETLERRFEEVWLESPIKINIIV